MHRLCPAVACASAKRGCAGCDVGNAGAQMGSSLHIIRHDNCASCVVLLGAPGGLHPPLRPGQQGSLAASLSFNSALSALGGYGTALYHPQSQAQGAGDQGAAGVSGKPTRCAAVTMLVQ